MIDETDESKLHAHRQRLLREAYMTVFGVEGQRTEMQELVLKDLERLTKFGDTAIVKDGGGRYDGGLTAYKAGLQDVMKRIYLRLRWREPDDHSSRHPESGAEPAGTA